MKIRILAWKIYFFVFVGALSFGVYATSILDGFDAWLYLILLLDAVAVVGLFGYAFHKAFISQRFWFAYFALFIAAQAIDFVKFSTEGVTAVEFVLISIFALPAYLGLFLYCLPTNRIWKVNANKTAYQAPTQ